VAGALIHITFFYSLWLYLAFDKSRHTFGQIAVVCRKKGKLVD
jgi:hypothetical protein